MKKVLLFALLILVFSANTTKMKIAKKTPFFVGTYTNGESKGIYQYEIDENGFLVKVIGPRTSPDDAEITNWIEGK